MSDGYDEDECSQLANSSWECEHHDPIEEAMEEYMIDLLHDAFNESDMYYYNGGNNDAGDGLLNMSELVIFIEEIDHIDEELESASTQIMISAFDEDGDGSLNMTEFADFMEIMDDDHDEDHSDEDNGDNHPDHHNEGEGHHCLLYTSPSPRD